MSVRNYSKLWETSRKEDLDPILNVVDSPMNEIPSQVTLVVSEVEESARWYADYRMHREMVSGQSQGDFTLSFCTLSSCF